MCHILAAVMAAVVRLLLAVWSGAAQSGAQMDGGRPYRCPPKPHPPHPTATPQASDLAALLEQLRQPAEAYWAERSALAWN